MRRTLLLLVSLIAAHTQPARADVASTMASMPNEAASCRYLKSICDDAERALDKGKPDTFSRLADDATEALKVMRAKYGKTPKCAQCTILKRDALFPK